MKRIIYQMPGKSTIKNLLVDFEADPSPAVWNSIQSNLLQDKKRSRRKFMLIFFLLLIGGGGTTAWLIERYAENQIMISPLNNSVREKLTSQQTIVRPAKIVSPSGLNQPATNNNM